MDENKFWLSLWQTVAAALCIIVISTHLYYSYKLTHINEMVKAGANPMDIRCMDAASNDTICMVRK